MKENYMSSPGLRMAMIASRRRLFFATADVANALHISEKELSSYEKGTADIPREMMQMIISMGYLMLRARNIQHEYTRAMHFIRSENLMYAMPK